MTVALRFVPMGTMAPDDLPPDEIWIDVGGRAAAPVFDHHSDDTEVWSATELIYDEAVAGRLATTTSGDGVTLVLHDEPDLDAIAASWLIRRSLRGRLGDKALRSIAGIVRAISENDQGMVRATDPERCWPVVARSLVAVLPATDAAARTRQGWDLLERTAALLEKGVDLSEAAARLVTPTLRIELARARRYYLEDLSRGQRFQVQLPLCRRFDRATANGATVDSARPGPGRALADGLFLVDPVSPLFREFARGDREHSPLGQGFSLLVVTWNQGESERGPLRRHVISTDPLSGLHLPGLGEILEREEQRLEDASDAPLAAGRERLEPETGRFGLGVESPWYDGRGHGHTIIDSPAVTIDGRQVLHSGQTSEQVLETVWQYGDPAAHTALTEAELLLACPVRVDRARTDSWPEPRSPDAATDLLEDVRITLSSSAVVAVHAWPSGDQPMPAGARLSGRQIWRLADGSAIWIGRFSFDRPPANVRQLRAAVVELRQAPIAETMPAGAAPAPAGSLRHAVFCRLPAEEIQLDDVDGASAILLWELAHAGTGRFEDRPTPSQLQEAELTMTRHRRLIVGERGLALASTADTELAAEPGLLRPHRFATLWALTLVQELALAQLCAAFARHQSVEDPIRGGELILVDRRRLMKIELQLLFERISDDRFPQRCYEALWRHRAIAARLADARDRIGTLAETVRDARADLYQKVAFWISVIFGPLIIASGMFSGVHLLREYRKINIPFLSPDWFPPGMERTITSGWFQYLLVLATAIFGTALIWSVLRRRDNGRRLFRRRRREPLDR